MAAAGTSLRLAAAPLLAYGLPFVTFYPFLLVASIWGGSWGGLIALGLSGSAAAWLFFRPGDPVLPIALGSFAISGGVVVAAGALMAEAVRLSKESERRHAATEAELRTLVSELAHRGRNAIAVLMAIVSQSVRKAGSLEEAERIINARLDALARAQDEVLKAGGGATSLPALLTHTLEPFDLSRFDIDCEGSALVAPDAAAAVSLIVHELATNAVKYGALSTAGRVRVHCRGDARKSQVEWREVGGPPVRQPAALGFGDRLLRMALAPHGGRAQRRFDPLGVICELEIPSPEPTKGRPASRASRGVTVVGAASPDPASQ